MTGPGAPIEAPSAPTAAGVRVVIDVRPLQDPERAPLTAIYLRELLAALDADPLEGESFFVLATACCLPGLALLLFLMRSADTHQPQAVAVEP